MMVANLGGRLPAQAGMLAVLVLVGLLEVGSLQRVNVLRHDLPRAIGLGFRKNKSVHLSVSLLSLA